MTISCCYSRSCEFSHFARVTLSGLDYSGLVGRCPYCRVMTAVSIGRYPCPLASYCPPGSWMPSLGIKGMELGKSQMCFTWGRYLLLRQETSCCVVLCSLGHPYLGGSAVRSALLTLLQTFACPFPSSAVGYVQLGCDPARALSAFRDRNGASSSLDRHKDWPDTRIP